VDSTKIAPSILAADFTRLGHQIAECEAAGADFIHVDIMDGRFVPNISFGPLIVEAAKRVTSVPLDVHLMVVEPEKYVADFARAGASRITIHVEASPHLHRTLQTIRELNLIAGVALNPHTPIGAIAEVLHLVNVVIVMTVNPGFGGQSLIASALPKFGQLREIAGARGLSLDLTADGGVNVDTAASVAAAGANVLVAGSAVFNSRQTVSEGIAALRSAAAGDRK
jgi:ribulose-phosphate 3-epimerase